GEDLGDINPYYGHCLRDRPLIAIDRVRYVGEPVAVVAAENTAIANEALSLIEVCYRELPCLATVDDALAPRALLLHENVAGVGEFHEMARVEKRRNPTSAITSISRKGMRRKASPRRMRSSTKPMSSR